MVALVDVVPQSVGDEVFEMLEGRVCSAGEGVDRLDSAIKVLEASGDVVSE